MRFGLRILLNLQPSELTILECGKMQGKRVRLFGWVHHIRTQKSVTFVDLRDGQGFLQCVLPGPELPVKHCLLSSSGTLWNLQAFSTIFQKGKRAAGVATAPPLELIVDWWRTANKSLKKFQEGTHLSTNGQISIPDFIEDSTLESCAWCSVLSTRPYFAPKFFQFIKSQYRIRHRFSSSL
ncbi:hypothetical protein Pelo_5406 [Pelomyxa schiedti]|nr:hypothetical protein Pelo_5406 [Pelomyxa schiedti]